MRPHNQDIVMSIKDLRCIVVLNMLVGNQDKKDYTMDLWYIAG